MPKIAMIINIFQARYQLSGLIKRVREGETVVIANRGTPVARLVPVDDAATGLGDATTILEWLDENPLPSHLQRTTAEINASIDAERSSWE